MTLFLVWTGPYVGTQKLRQEGAGAKSHWICHQSVISLMHVSQRATEWGVCLMDQLAITLSCFSIALAVLPAS